MSMRLLWVCTITGVTVAYRGSGTPFSIIGWDMAPTDVQTLSNLEGT